MFRPIVEPFSEFGLTYWLWGVINEAGELVASGRFMSEQYAQAAADRAVINLKHLIQQ